ncbi:Hydrogenase maturation protein, carbamoyl dehydratase HypE [Clostridium sp. USBA 49]|jgi:hydrogenase expression/formation protein HypE|uniref:AIR synthase family protein n=1 Tax=Clostridium TaxID=1485 RepID=UPI00099AFCA7|nr:MULTISPECIES: AIR synthase family protein [Clostridium]SKA79803.1 Hydrogenase maturation protein, carbamoyl dehydratase HypE [Clostridium sp. USBA 49]
MKSGKLNWDDLNKIIKNNRSVNRKEVKVRPGIGEDCSIIDFGDYECALSTDPITGTERNIGKLAVHINCNDIASTGIEPLGILVTILAPEGTDIEQIDSIMKEIDEETKKLNVEILGGHTEITKAVNKIIVSCTAIGKGKNNTAISTSGAKIGDDIIVTKSIGMEGTYIVVNDYFEYIKDLLSFKEIIEVKEYINKISVVKEGVIAGKFGVNSMHDITEGGVLGALWEMAKASLVGFKVYKEKMPISTSTYKICNKFDVNPLRLISSGSMLITTKDGAALIEKFKENGINASIIGKVTKEKGILVENNVEIEVEPPERDELFIINEKINKFGI